LIFFLEDKHPSRHKAPTIKRKEVDTMPSKPFPHVLRQLVRQSRTTPISTSRLPVLLTPQSSISNTRIRWNSTQQPQPQTPSQSPSAEPPPNPHVCLHLPSLKLNCVLIPDNRANSQYQRNFYKEFGRPVAKVFLMAIFTYQLVYFFWAALDIDASVREKEGL